MDEAATPTVTHKQYLKLTEYLKVKQNPALLPTQIAYYTGLRIGKVCGLTWSDINLDEQYLTVRRSIRYNATGTSLKSARQSRIKSARLISAIRWQIFLGKRKRNRRKTKRTTASFTVATFTLRSQRKTANIMRSIRCQAPRKSPTVISQSILCVCDLTVHLNHRARWEQCAEQSEKRLRVWRTSTFICFATRSQAICCQAEQHQRTCRNCSDIPTSVPQ